MTDERDETCVWPTGVDASGETYCGKPGAGMGERLWGLLPHR